MVRFVNKNLKAHQYEQNELIMKFIDHDVKIGLFNLIASQLNDLDSKFGKSSKVKRDVLIQVGSSMENLISEDYGSTKNLFLLLEIIIYNYSSEYSPLEDSPYIFDFINDINDFFLIKQIPFQIKFLKDDEFYVEKIIDENTSNQITKTLESFSDTQKVFDDFKDAIKSYSTGNNPESIRKCCISIEDYFCVILGKKSCNSVSSYYNNVSKKLGIPNDLDEKFKGIINYIHKYRSIDNHGRLEHSEVEDIELVNQVIIQFTMTILHFVKSKYEK